MINNLRLKIKKQIFILVSIILLITNIKSYVFLEQTEQEEEQLTDLETFCVKQGGDVKLMVAKYDTHKGWVDGITKKFCLFNDEINNSLALFGLESLASHKSNFASTYIKTIKLYQSKEIPGPYGLVNMNLCHQLRGAMISFATDGGYDKNGQADLCFFGDGSSVSGWTLYYIGLGYFENLRVKVQSEPLLIDLPDVYFNREDEY